MKRTMAIFTVAVLLLSLSIFAAASSAPDWSQDGKSSITIHLNLPENLETYGDLCLYRVGSIREDDGNFSFVPAGVFAQKWTAYEDLFSAQLALDLSVHAVEQNVECVTRNISEAGIAVFTELELGLYLVVQKNPAEGYECIDPFLIGVPNVADGAYVYQIDASPKVQLETVPTEPTTEPTTEPSEPTDPTEPSPPDLPQTGQLNWPVPVLAVAGMILVLSGALLCTGKRRDRHAA